MKKLLAAFALGLLIIAACELPTQTRHIVMVCFVTDTLSGNFGDPVSCDSLPDIFLDTATADTTP
jgi:hypothetical protein